MTDYDPIDLAMLAAGWTRGAGPYADTLSTTRAEELLSVARMLDRLYAKLHGDDLGIVWAYEVAEPLGYWIGDEYAIRRRSGDDCDDFIGATLEEAEARARQLIDDAMEGF